MIFQRRALALLVSVSMAFASVPTTALADQVKAANEVASQSAQSLEKEEDKSDQQQVQQPDPAAPAPEPMDPAPAAPASETPEPTPGEQPAQPQPSNDNPPAADAPAQEPEKPSTPETPQKPAAPDGTGEENGTNVGEGAESGDTDAPTNQSGDESEGASEDTPQNEDKKPAAGDEENAEDEVTALSEGDDEEEDSEEEGSDEEGGQDEGGEQNEGGPNKDDEEESDEEEDETVGSEDEDTKAPVLSASLTFDGSYSFGALITWEITVTNPNDDTQTVTLTAPDDVTLDETTLEVAGGATQTTYATYEVTEQDILHRDHECAPGSLSAAIADKSISCELPVASVEVPSPSLGITTRMTSVPSVMNPPDVSYGVGETVSYEIDVVNDGNVTLTNVRFTTRMLAKGAPEIVEDAEGDEGGSSNVPHITFDSMAPGDWRIIKVEYPIVSADAGHTVANYAAVGAPIPTYEDHTPVSTGKAPRAISKTPAIDVRDEEEEPEPADPTDPTDPTDPSDPKPAIPAPVVPSMTPLPSTTSFSIPYVVSVVGPASDPVVLPNADYDTTSDERPSPVTVVTDDTTPLTENVAPAKKAGWALLNMISMILGVLLGIMAMRGPRRVFGLMSLLCGVGAVVVFVLTQNMALPMVMANTWTPLMVGFVVGAGLFAALSRTEDST